MTGVLAFECALSSLTSVIVHSRRAALRFFFAFATFNLLAPCLMEAASIIGQLIILLSSAACLVEDTEKACVLAHRQRSCRNCGRSPSWHSGLAHFHRGAHPIRGAVLQITKAIRALHRMALIGTAEGFGAVSAKPMPRQASRSVPPQPFSGLWLAWFNFDVRCAAHDHLTAESENRRVACQTAAVLPPNVAACPVRPKSGTAPQGSRISDEPVGKVAASDPHEPWKAGATCD